MYYLGSLGKLDHTQYFHKFSSDAINIHKTLNMDSTSAYLPQINEIIRRDVEAGIMKKIMDEIVDLTGIRRKSMDVDRMIKSFIPLSLFHKFSCFSYLVLGLGLSIAVFIFEIIISKYVILRKVGPTKAFYVYKQ